MAKKFSELRCGDKIRFGAYSVENEGAHQIHWIKVDSADTTILAERIEDFRAFDARERNNGNEYRRDYGNNRYSVSNIDQFLNSSGDRWYNARHEYDAPPTDDTVYNETGYENHPGFLYYFAEWELDAILDTEVVTALAKCEGDQEYEIVVRKVFLPSVTNLFGRTVRNTHEGSQWEYFRNGADRSAYATSHAIRETRGGSKPNNEDYEWYYSLRSPNADSSYYVRYVGRDGGYSDCSAYDGQLGVRPALRLNPDILVSDKPDDDGYYDIIQSEAELAEVSDEELFAILMK